MITCKLMGGLGNQLFQIFTVISLALKNSIPFYFLNENELIAGKDSTIRYTYWNTFLSMLKPFLRNNILPNPIINKEQSFEFNKNIYDLKMNQTNNHLLFGYFQSHMYFDKYKSQICKLIKLEQKRLEVLTKLEETYDFQNTISIHFRVGDYAKLQHIHPVLPKEYYESALNYLINLDFINKQTNKKTILYFYEEQDKIQIEEIIEYLKSKFVSYFEFKSVNILLEDWEQLLLMGCCKYNIIANSTFSWWGAYLNRNLEQIVLYPSIWFGPTINNNTCDLFPCWWHKIEW